MIMHFLGQAETMITLWGHALDNFWFTMWAISTVFVVAGVILSHRSAAEKKTPMTWHRTHMLSYAVYIVATMSLLLGANGGSPLLLVAVLLSISVVTFLTVYTAITPEHIISVNTKVDEVAEDAAAEESSENVASLIAALDEPSVNDDSEDETVIEDGGLVVANGEVAVVETGSLREEKAENAAVATKAAPAKKAPVKKAPAKRAAPAKKAPVKKAPVKKVAASTRATGTKTTGTKTTGTKTAPAKKAPVKKAPAKKAPATKAPVKKAAPAKAPAKKAPAKKASVKKAAPAKRAAAGTRTTAMPTAGTRAKVVKKAGVTTSVNNGGSVPVVASD